MISLLLRWQLFHFLKTLRIFFHTPAKILQEGRIWINLLWKRISIKKDFEKFKKQVFLYMITFSHSLSPETGFDGNEVLEPPSL